MKILSNRRVGFVLGELLHKKIDLEKLDEIYPKATEMFLKEEIENKLRMKKSEKIREILLTLSSLDLEERIKILDDIHPSHFIEFIEEGIPFFSGLLLKSLNKNKGREILSFLDNERKMEIVYTTRGKRESPFVKKAFQIFLIKKLNIGGKLILKNLEKREIVFLMTWKEIEILMEELGLKEITIACKNLAEEALSTLLRKFNKEEKKKITKKLEVIETPPEGVILNARKEILEIVEKYYKKGEIVRIIGLYKLAQIFFPYNKEQINLLTLKMAKHLGEIFQKMINNLTKEGKELNLNEMKEVERTIKYLSEMEKINGDWKFYL